MRRRPERTAARAAVVVAALLGASLPGCAYDELVATVAGPPAGGLFPTTPAGQPLPDDAACLAAVPRSAWEPRPENAQANVVRPTAPVLAGLAPWDGTQGYDDRAAALGRRVDGAFSGTTDEILQWIACKWGVSDDMVRAMAAEATRWRQDALACWTTAAADCPPDAATRSSVAGTECAVCYGILQIAWKYHRTTWPMARASTAFNADYVTGLLRACFEGYATYLAASATPAHPYVAGDLPGCIGALFSGGWYDVSGINHAAAVAQYASARPWRTPGY